MIKYRFLLGIVFLIIVVYLTKQSAIFLYSDYVNTTIDNNFLYFSKEKDICKFTNCTYITKIEPSYIAGYKDVFLDFKHHYYIHNNKTNEYIYLDTSYVSMVHNKATLIFLPVLILVFFVFLMLANRESSMATLRVISANEIILTHQSMIEISENIHHELNTPIEIIDNKVHEIEEIFKRILDNDLCSDDESSINKILKDFEFIKESSEYIYGILDKMKGFKSIRYSNGNKSIYDIIESSFSLISQTNSNFTSEVSNEFKKYSINHNFNFKNVDLLSIMINHIKNSLEANSNKIIVLFSQIDSGYLYFRIIDNGSGIPEKTQKNIFEPNFSTKITVDSVRGNGLYLNKSALTLSKGNLILVDSSKYGTTFEIRLPVVEKV